MTLLWIDGFEGFGAADGSVDTAYNSNAGGTATITVPSGGRVSGKYCDIRSTASETGYIELPLAGFGSSSTTWVTGFAYRQTPSAWGGSSLLSFYDINGDEFFSLFVQAATLQAYRGGSAGTRLGAADFNFVSTIWYYIECKVLFDGSSGTVDVRVHNQNVLSLTSQNTTSTGNTSPFMIRFRGSRSKNSVDYDDLYVCDGVDATATQGQSFNDFLGDNIVERLTPNANGTTNDYSVTGAASNFEAVDESDPDDDSTYVSSSTATEKDLYAVSSISTTPASIAAVAAKSYTRKTDGGARTFVHVCRSGTTESDSSSIAPSTDYAHYQSIYGVDPDTSSAWTESGINAAEFGTKVDS